MLCLLSCPLRGREFWGSDDEFVVWEAGGYLKSHSLAMHFRDIAIYPGKRAAMTSARGRVGSDLFVGDFRLNVEYEFRLQTQTSGLEGQDTLPGMGTTQSGRPRLWDPTPDTADGVTLDHDLDRAWVTGSLGPVDLRVGRQAISWGSAWFWKPTDRFSPFSPMDVDPDVKRGVDAVRAECFFGPSTSLDLIATFERHPDEDRVLWVNGGTRFRTTIGRYDLALSAARFQHADQGNWMAGAEFSGELGDVGFRGEGAFNYLDSSGSWDLEAVVGLDYHFAMGLTLAGEFFYNGYGTADPDRYIEYYLDEDRLDQLKALSGKTPEELAAMEPLVPEEFKAAYETFVANPLDLSDADPARGERLRRGEAFHVGRYYLGLSANQELNPLLHLVMTAISNLGDASLFISAGLRWSVVENGRFTAGAVIPVGQKPRGYQMKSEFGAMPVIGYGVLKLSF